VRDAEGKTYVVKLTNMQSSTVVQSAECTAPLTLTLGWNNVSIDIPDIVHRAFGVKYDTTVRVQVQSTCRLWHAFFEEQLYADAELPYYLRVL